MSAPSFPPPCGEPATEPPPPEEPTRPDLRAVAWAGLEARRGSPDFDVRAWEDRLIAQVEELNE